MRRYFCLAIANFMETISYKMHLILTFISNIIYIVLIYFLWKEIFVVTNGTIAGMNFEKTFLYIASASCISTLYITWVDAHIADSILNGNIVMKLLRPMDYMLYMIFEKLGTVMSNCVIIFLPTMIFLGIIFKGEIIFGFNIIFFVISLFLGFIM